MEYGTIFDIKQFAVFDGPGMRQTVFLKGCPLSCSWCHNPEGQKVEPEMMVSVASCVGCGECKKVCPSPDNCISCGACIYSCPLNLRRIAGEKISTDELERRIRKDAAFYERNGGGVTFSGGEPLMQSEFLIETLIKVKDLHRAIETSGFISGERYKEVYRNLDFIIQDFKIIDQEMHKKYIGVPNDSILGNIEYLCRGTKPFIIRIPMIPGITDTNENITGISNFLKGSKSLVRVELLPYQAVAGAKYGMVGRKYEPQFEENRELNINLKAFEINNIRSVVL